MENEFEVVVPLSYIENLIRENQKLKEQIKGSELIARWSVDEENGRYVAKEISKINWQRSLAYK